MGKPGLLEVCDGCNCGKKYLICVSVIVVMTLVIVLWVANWLLVVLRTLGYLSSSLSLVGCRKCFLCLHTYCELKDTLLRMGLASLFAAPMYAVLTGTM